MRKFFSLSLCMKFLYIFAFFVLIVVILAIVFLMLIIFNVIPTPNTTPSNTNTTTIPIAPIVTTTSTRLQLKPESSASHQVLVCFVPFGMSTSTMQKGHRHMSVSKTSLGSLYHLQLPSNPPDVATWRLCLPLADVPLSNRPVNSGVEIFIHKDEHVHPATVSVLSDRILIDSDVFTSGSIINIPKTNLLVE